jgi:mannan endo-1,6-alpha-mannosidase
MRLFTTSSSTRTTLFDTLFLFFTSIHIAQAALTVTVGDATSYRKAASNAAFDMMTYYNGNQSGQIPGKLEGTWWEGGAMFMTIMEYWHWTGDSTYNDEAIQGMQWQAGNADYMPNNYSNYLVCFSSLFSGPFCSLLDWQYHCDLILINSLIGKR